MSKCTPQEIMSKLGPEGRSKLIFDDLLPEIKSEAAVYARLRFEQFTAYQDAGFTIDQSMQLMAMPRVQT
jgi:hypothetical protein